MLIRNLQEYDYYPIITNLDQWWGGRPMTDMLPRLFFKYFNDTSYVIEENKQVVAFIVGFISQVSPNQAYVHFIGIHPEFRNRGLGRQLYEIFFDAIKSMSCEIVYLVTSPINKNSLAFHTRLGFQIQDGNCIVDGLDVTTNYDGPGEDRVLFWRAI